MLEVSSDFEEIDLQKWSDFVKNHDEGNIFQTPEMFRIYSRVKNYNPEVICLIDRNEICAILVSVTQASSLPLFSKFSLRSIIIGGPLISPNYDKGKILEIILKKYSSLLHPNLLFTQIRNVHSKEYLKDDFESLGFKHKSHLNFILNLEEGEDFVWMNMNKKRRNSIKKSTKFDIEIQSINNNEDIEKSYKILKAVYSDRKMPLADISLFLNSFKFLRNKGMISAFNTIFENQVIATLWVLKYKNSYYDWYSASNSNFSYINPNDSLIWFAIREAISEGYNTFDFGGAGSPNESYGVRDFKKKFGGDEVNYGRLQKTHKPLISNLVMYLFNNLRLIPIKFK